MKFVLSFLYALAISNTALAAEMTAAGLSSEIRLRGAGEAVETLVATGQWDHVTDLMASGKEDWIALAPSLANGTDAGTSEDLGISLAFALPKSPRAVLEVIDPKDGPVLGVDRVCGVPFIEGTIDNVDTYIRDAKRAVSTVSNPGLANIKTACLKALN